MKMKWPEMAERWKGALGKYQYVLLVIAVGVVLLLLPTGSRDSPQEAQDPAQEEGVSFDLDAFETKLEAVLSQVEGAGETKVVLTLDGGSRQVLARNQEQGSGGSSNTVATVGRGSGAQEVVPLQTVAPQFRGALVVCPGGGDAQVRLKLIEAVSALTGLGSDRISVCAGGP